MEKNPVLQDDILRYKKNKFASSFALLALVFNCLYFALLYSVMSTDLYKLQLGFSVIINLLVLLVGFYSSEGIKGYNKKFSIVLLVLAAIQLIRIAYYPAMGSAKNWLNDSNIYFGVRMNNSANATVMIIYLVASAACFIVSAVQGFIVARRLEVFQKRLDKGEVSVEDTLKEIEEKEAQTAAQTVVADSNNKPSEVRELVDAEEKTLSTGEADNG